LGTLDIGFKEILSMREILVAQAFQPVLPSGVQKIPRQPTIPLINSPK
jgi:hypothetical protein